MRLVCPNCDAEYEVDAALIPDSGRDVQCSNCGHAWFQNSPSVEADEAAEEALFASSSGRDDDAPAAYDEDLAPEPAPVAAAGAAPAVARGIDASVLSVLREEAERESRARLAEAGPLETQAELGLSGAAAAPAADRIARMKGDAEAYGAPEVTNARPGPAKSEMLPEIDTINSTLRAKSERRTGEQAAIAETMTDRRGSGSFRRGFVLSMSVIVLALALYLLAPTIAAKFPAVEGPLRSYVAFVEALRGRIDGVLQAAVTRISAIISPQ